MRIVRKELTILQGEVTTADARGLEPRRERVDVRYILVGPVHLTCTFAGGQQVGPADGVSQITSGGLGIGLHRPLGADNPSADREAARRPSRLGRKEPVRGVGRT